MTWNPGITPVAGSKVSIGSNAVAQSDELADTYVDIGEITDIGAFGIVYQLIKFVSIQTRRTRKFRGTYDQGDIVLKVGRNFADPGQAAVLAALTSDLNFNLRVQLNDASGTVVTDAANALTAPGSAVLHFASTTGIQPGMTAVDATTANALAANSFVKAVGSTSVTLNVGAVNTVGSTDTITFTSAPTTMFFGAKVMQFDTVPGGPNAVVMGQINLAIDTDITVIAPS